MNEINDRIRYKDKEYDLVFNLNVMEVIQEKYGTVEAWADLLDVPEDKEPDIKALKFGFREMLNEGIDIANDENGTKEKALTLKQVGRMLTEVGISKVTEQLQQKVIDSTQSAEKNA